MATDRNLIAQMFEKTIRMVIEKYKSKAWHNIKYPIVFGVFPAAVFTVLYRLDLLSGLLATIYGISYFALYIPFSLWIINRHFPFRIKSITKILFWVPYLIFSLLCVYLIFMILIIFLIRFLTGEFPVDGSFITLLSFILGIVFIVFIIKKSRKRREQE